MELVETSPTEYATSHAHGLCRYKTFGGIPFLMEDSSKAKDEESVINTPLCVCLRSRSFDDNCCSRVFHCVFGGACTGMRATQWCTWTLPSTGRQLVVC